MSQNDADLREAGERIEKALNNLGQIADPRVRARAQEVLQLVLQLYGTALERTVQLLQDRAANDVLKALADDDLIASLLLVHDLHPLPLAARVEQALDEVRPYMDSHGGDVRLVELNGEAGEITLELLGSCDGCGASATTLELAVRGAIESAAPEIATINTLSDKLEEGSGGDEDGGLISADSLHQRPEAFGGPMGQSEKNAHQQEAPTWAPLSVADQMKPGEIVSTEMDGMDVLVCRLENGVYAYHDRCRQCHQSLGGGTLEGPQLSCPGCDAVYDIQKAGRVVESAGGPLQPLPVLERDGKLEVAIPAVVA